MTINYVTIFQFISQTLSGIDTQRPTEQKYTSLYHVHSEELDVATLDVFTYEWFGLSCVLCQTYQMGQSKNFKQRGYNLLNVFIQRVRLLL